MHQNFLILDYIQDNKLTDEEPDQTHNNKEVGFVVLQDKNMTLKNIYD